jgi:hypothetical protein
MKRILLVALACASTICSAQTFKVQNLDVLGTSTLTGIASFTMRPVFNGATPWDNANLPSPFQTTGGTISGATSFSVRPTFAGNTPWDSGNLVNPALSTTGNVIKFSWSTPTASQVGLTVDSTYQGYLWHSGNFNPSSYLTTAAAAATYAPLDLCANIMQYGGNNSASANNDSAWTAAIASESGSSQKCVYFPRGYYKFANAVNYTLAAINTLTVRGDGPGNTNIYWAGNGGFQIGMTAGDVSAAVHFRDLSLLAGTSGVQSAIGLVNAGATGSPVPTEVSDITNVSIHGSDGWAQTNYWLQGVFVESWSNINFTNLNVVGSGGGGDLPGYTGQGIGVDLTANSPPFGVVYNFAGCQLNYLQYGIQYGTNVQGVTVSQSNFVGGKVGIFSPSSSGTSQLTVQGSQFNDSDAGIQDNGGIPAVAIMGNYFLIPTPASSNAGVQLSSVAGAQITGNQFQRIGSAATGTNGLVVGASSATGAVTTGNIFTALGTGVFFQAGSSRNNLQSNGYLNNSTNFVNSGGAACPPSGAGNCMGTSSTP